jgi:hypothetical protein
MDPAAPSILNASGYISLYNKEQVAMTLHHTVKASMKNDVYSIKVCFTKEELVSCNCTCKAGAFGIERVLCVHILPVLYSVTQLMFDGLSAHFLGQFSSVFNHEEEQLLPKERVDELKKIFVSLQ